ncbi:hypothetical protein [Hirschia baltica]|uniref:Uncharacterized protein n=1 Tax=Hirschia baltica (strain ATCC 49814 / DSM 5838 / IFAM 1418) TaxID=582402 RepID=C6XMH8_HIRBI|nr:hypothetical protein [Hirschia baltica]ACT58121.1 hypothetical protein Hbal_0419 [Hirschia baltica ATCC 49814]
MTREEIEKPVSIAQDTCLRRHERTGFEAWFLHALRLIPDG